MRSGKNLVSLVGDYVNTALHNGEPSPDVIREQHIAFCDVGGVFILLNLLPKHLICLAFVALDR